MTEREKNQRERQLRRIESLMRENPDGKPTGGSTRKLVHGLRRGQQVDAEWMRMRCPSKVTKRILTPEELKAL